MPRELLILRHAKSDWGSAATTDFARPLTGRGKRDAPKIGAWLHQEGLQPDHVVSSPAQRARQTAIRVCKTVGFPKGLIDWEPEVYEATLDNLLAALGRCPPDATRVLLVGHNPGLETLLQFLAGGELDLPEDGKLLPAGALARLEMPEDWSPPSQGCAKLLSITRPRAL